MCIHPFGVLCLLSSVVSLCELSWVLCLLFLLKCNWPCLLSDVFCSQRIIVVCAFCSVIFFFPNLSIFKETRSVFWDIWDELNSDLSALIFYEQWVDATAGSCSQNIKALLCGISFVCFFLAHIWVLFSSWVKTRGSSCVWTTSDLDLSIFALH